MIWQPAIFADPAYLEDILADDKIPDKEAVNTAFKAISLAPHEQKEHLKIALAKSKRPLTEQERKPLVFGYPHSITIAMASSGRPFTEQEAEQFVSHPNVPVREAIA